MESNAVGFTYANGPVISLSDAYNVGYSLSVDLAIAVQRTPMLRSHVRPLTPVKSLASYVALLAQYSPFQPLKTVRFSDAYHA